MARRIVDAAEAFAHQWHLSRSELPVDLSQLYRVFVPEYRPMTGQEVLSFSMFPEGPEVSVHRPGLIVIEESLSIADRRLVYAHELGHWIGDHPASAPTYSISGWLHDRIEREASLAGLVLLMPIGALEDDELIESFASRAQVRADLGRWYWEQVMK